MPCDLHVNSVIRNCTNIKTIPSSFDTFTAASPNQRRQSAKILLTEYKNSSTCHVFNQ